MEAKVVDFLDSLGQLRDLFKYSFHPRLEKHNGRNVVLLNTKVGSNRADEIRELPWDSLVIYGACGHYAASRDLNQYYVLGTGGEWFPEQRQDVKKDDSARGPAASSSSASVPAAPADTPHSPTPPVAQSTSGTASSDSL